LIEEGFPDYKLGIDGYEAVAGPAHVAAAGDAAKGREVAHSLASIEE
jgi:hypothetical protein